LNNIKNREEDKLFDELNKLNVDLIEYNLINRETTSDIDTINPQKNLEEKEIEIDNKN
jgi:hypothetical protein